MRFEALIWKLSEIFLLILITQRVIADHEKSTTQPLTGQREKSEEKSRTDDVRRVNETSSPFDYLYDTLVDNGLNKMCSVLRNTDAQQIIGSLGQDYTILAPSDEAFSLVAGSKLDELTNDPEKRREFVLRHIIPGRFVLNRLGPNDETEVAALDGHQLHITAYPNGFVINGANVVNGDIPIAKTNSLIHIIDRVRIPEKESNLLELMEENPQLSQISSFLTLSGLQKELTTKNSWTFFTPNDEAFRAVPWPITQQMLSNNTFLRLLIANHIIPGKHYSTGLPGNQLYSIGGDLLNLTARTVQSRKLVLVNSVPIINADLIASNGVIHVITRIILPKHLLDDCNCIPKSNRTTTEDENRRANYNETSLSDDRASTTSDPLLRDFGLEDLVPSNQFDRRFGAIPRNQFQNEDHFSSTPKPVSFKSFWDDIFGTSEQPSNATESTALARNDSQTTLNEQGQNYSVYKTTTTETRQSTDHKPTDTPLIWDPFSTEAQPTGGRFTYRPTSSVEPSERPKMENESETSSVNQTSKTEGPDLKSWDQSDRLRPFTPGVEYDNQPNSSTTTIDSLSSQFPSTTWPSIRTRPYYRPEIRTEENSAQTEQKNVNSDSSRFETQTNSNFRPTEKPYFRPSSITAENGSSVNKDWTSGTTPRMSLGPEDKPRPVTRNQYERRSGYKPFPVEEPIEQVNEDETIEPTLAEKKRNHPKIDDRGLGTRKEPKTNEPYGSDRQTSISPDSLYKYESERPRPQLRPGYSLNQTKYLPENHSLDSRPRQFSRPEDRRPIPETHGSSPGNFSRRQLRPYHDTSETDVLPEYESMRRYPEQRSSEPPYQTYQSEPPRRETRPYFTRGHAQPSNAFDWTRSDQNPNYPQDSERSSATQPTYRRQGRPSFPSYYPYSPDSENRPNQQEYPSKSEPFSRKGVEQSDTRSDTQPLPPSYGSQPEDFSRRQLRPNYRQDDRKSSARTDSLNRYPQQYRNPSQQSPYYDSKNQSSVPVEGTYAEQPYRRQNMANNYRDDQYSGEAIDRIEEKDRTKRPIHRPTPRDFDSRIESERRSQQNGDESSREPRPGSRQEKYGHDPRNRAIEPNERRLGPIDYNTMRRYGEQPLRRPDPKQTTKSTTRPEERVGQMKKISQIIESPNLTVDGKDKQFSVLKDMMISSGLWDVLDRPTNYITILMPTDDAFNSLSDDLVEQIKVDPSLVRKLLMQHILSYGLPPQNLRNNMIVKSLNGEPHLINIVEGGKIVVNGIGVIAVTSAQNGIVYVVDQLLQKPEGKSRSIMDELRKRSDLSRFSSLIQRSNYGQVLSKGPGPYTVFVPNNNAFFKLESITRELANNRRALDDFIRNHVMEGAVYKSELNDAPDYDSDGKSNSYGYGYGYRYKDGSNGTKILSSDITTGNGVIHIIDNILSENNRFEKRAPKSDKLRERNSNKRPDESSGQTPIASIGNKLGTRRFINWLTKSGLIDDMIRDKRQYTVIVPNDRAVGKLPLKIQSLLNTEPSKLKNLLEYHILPGFVSTQTLKDNEILTTINGKEIRFNKLENGTLLTFSGAPIAKQEYYENLLIVSVDSVLYPPQGSIETIISRSPILKTLAQLIKNAGMEQELAESGPIAIFAPKDEAFNQIDSKAIERLKSDANASREFLKKHIIPKAMFTSSIPISSDGSDVRTAQALSGDTLKFQRKPNCVSVNGIILSYADITATNGVLHVIDHVL